MVAVQGPKAIEMVGDALATDLRPLKRYGFENGTHGMTQFTAFRSGYTGEDGVELILASAMVEPIIKSIAGELMRPDAPIQPAGLGARDTLRLEAAMPLYGHELTQSFDPISAGLDWAVDLTKEFIGVEPLRVIAQHGPARKLVGLELNGPRIARQGTSILSGPTKIGEVTSGTFSPTLKKGIALAYVDARQSAVGTVVNVDLRGAVITATIVPLPFYKRSA
jgi:aminomethyltransferase